MILKNDLLAPFDRMSCFVTMIIYPDISDIALTDGASLGVNILLNALIADSRDGVMIPIPQYPLYSATGTLIGASEVHYYLDEESGW